MREATYTNEFGDEFMVEEMSRKEFVETAIWTIEAISECDSEDHVYIEYKNGKTYDNLGGYGESGKFRKTNIKFGVITNSCTYQIFGKYVMGENMVPESAA